MHDSNSVRQVRVASHLPNNLLAYHNLFVSENGREAEFLYSDTQI